eukprot:16435848-Heterocapsa_arctica.AAC.1
MLGRDDRRQAGCRGRTSRCDDRRDDRPDCDVWRSTIMVWARVLDQISPRPWRAARQRMV